MSTYTDALSAFIAADRELAELVVKERQWMEIPAVAASVETSTQRLAQAGDVLERELRQMILEERGEWVDDRRVPGTSFR